MLQPLYETLFSATTVPTVKTGCVPCHRCCLISMFEGDN